jgi:hypothetical protein
MGVMRRIALAALAAMSLAVLTASSRPAPPAQDATPPPPPTASCVFTNASYSGQCVETAEVRSGATPQEACESILRCLNDVGCPKTYCRATEIRSGWRLESATAK